MQNVDAGCRQPAVFYIYIRHPGSFHAGSPTFITLLDQAD
jgi:hypothetical protein